MNNNADCNFDGGDCCPCTCEDSTYSCATYGGDCDDCAVAQDASEICPEECTPPECGDGICSVGETYDSCPEDCDPPVCGDDTCNGDETYDSCPEDCDEPNDCPEGYVSDCVDDDCCSEFWIGDGLCDGEDQSWGCDLTCYDDDGGDCCSEYTCWDSSCVENEAECPEADCSNIADWDTCGLYVELYGYTCQEMENNFGYDYYPS